MTKHVRLTPDITPWFATDAAQSLIASLKANPPKLFEKVERYALTTDRWTEFAKDWRIDRLRKLWNKAFLAAEAEAGAAMDYDAFYAQPDVDDILAGIGPHERLFLGVKRNSAFDGLLPDMSVGHPLMEVEHV